MRYASLTAIAMGILAAHCGKNGLITPESPSGEGGRSSAGSTVDCTDAGAMAELQANVQTARSVSGVNGTFADSCDPAGNAVKYTCEVTGPCAHQGPCVQSLTGRVVSQNVDCAGACEAGACRARCPAVGEPMEYKVVGPGGASVTLESSTSGRDYACALGPQIVDPTYDCHATPAASLRVVVTDAGDAGAYCSSSSIHLVVGSTAVDPHCAYDCKVQP
jgi:hypothetical protein